MFNSQFNAWVFRYHTLALCFSELQHLIQWQYPQNLGGIGVGRLSAENLQYIWPGLLMITNRKLHTCFRIKIIDLGWLWMAITHSIAQNMHFFRAYTKIWIKINPYCWRRRCSPVTLVSCNISFVWIFTGVRWRGVIKRQWGKLPHCRITLILYAFEFRNATSSEP